MGGEGGDEGAGAEVDWVLLVVVVVVVDWVGPLGELGMEVP